MLTRIEPITPRPSWAKLFHVTHRGLLPSIRHSGLLPSRSRGAFKRTWLTGWDTLPWALRHVQEHHEWCSDDLIVLRVAVPETWLVSPRRGIYWLTRRIPRTYIGALQTCQY